MNFIQVTLTMINKTPTDVLFLNLENYMFTKHLYDYTFLLQTNIIFLL